MSEAPYHTHLFICVNGQPDQVGKCAHKGSPDLLHNLKAQATSLGKGLRINRSGCLGQCEKGIAAVLYPQAQWFYQLNADDTSTLMSHLTDATNSSSQDS
jgi:(2Fe-2S) ferredoxin